MEAGKVATVTSCARQITVEVEVDASTAMASDLRDGENVAAVTLGQGQLFAPWCRGPKRRG
jgi:hypothetical protein